MPLFLGLLEVEVPPGPAVSFLLASPTINLGAIILLFVVFGWRDALFYIAVCLLAAISVGWLIGRMPRERVLRDYLWFEEEEPGSGKRWLAFKKATFLGSQLTRRFLPWLALATLGGLLID
ncbi:MAG TPA: permease, partial [Ktedonobacteraceae bacterium]